MAKIAAFYSKTKSNIYLRTLLDFGNVDKVAQLFWYAHKILPILPCANIYTQ